MKWKPLTHFLFAVARLKGDSTLFGSSLIDYVSYIGYLIFLFSTNMNIFSYFNWRILSFL